MKLSDLTPEEFNAFLLDLSKHYGRYGEAMTTALTQQWADKQPVELGRIRQTIAKWKSYNENP